MTEQEHINYNRIAKAIDFIKAHLKEQPSLDEIAENVHLSPYHFQRLFTDWAGVSPKKFMQYLSLNYAKRILSEQKTLSDTAHQTGLSGTSRLHDLFVRIEGMTPAEFKNGGKELSINYSFDESPFGRVIVASTPKGVCHMAFFENDNDAFKTLKEKFPKALYTHTTDNIQQNAISIFKQDWNRLEEIKLHLKGTDFQLKVWEALLKIPVGGLSTYGNIAREIENPNASRAIGSAIGKNPVAFLIPCHRVIRSKGEFGGYMWGNTRKTAIIGWEAAKRSCF